jgi:hypothetical protein
VRGHHSAGERWRILDARTHLPDGKQKTEILCSPDWITGKEKKSYRELIGSALETYLTTTSNRLNDIMKVLTAMSAIMLVSFRRDLHPQDIAHDGAHKRCTHAH